MGLNQSDSGRCGLMGGWLLSTSAPAIVVAGGVILAPQCAWSQALPAPDSAQNIPQDDSTEASKDTSEKDESATSTDIVVTGFRGSIARSINAKKLSNEIVEVISAEDIGKLPGVSIAESLARLPGVAAQRVNGRAQVLSIRGMAPKFGMTLLNGQEMVSTGDDRSFEYDQFPSELVNSATLYKTPDASLGSMGLSGTVDIRTVRPLDVDGRKINLSARYDGNSMGAVLPGTKGWGSRISVSYIDQFADGKIGLAIGYARLDAPDKKKYFNMWDYGTGTNLGVDGLGDSYTFNGFETGVASTKTVRNGVLGVLQFKPSSHFDSKVDVFHSEFQQRMKGLEMIGVLANWASGSTPEVSMNGDRITIANASPILTMRQNNRDDEINAVSWSNTYNNGPWSVVANAGWSKAKRREWVGEAYVMTRSPVTLNVSLPTDYKSFGQVSSSADLSDLSNFALVSVWGGNLGGYAALANVADEMKTARLSTRHDLATSIFSAVEIGAIYGKRTKSLAYDQTSYTLTDSTDCLNGLTCQSIPSSLGLRTVDLSFIGLSNVPYFNVSDALNSSSYAQSNDPRDPAWNWGVREEVVTGFAKLDIKNDHWLPIRGNLGVQVIHTRQRASGLYADAEGNLSPVAGGTSYTDVLPSLNLTGELDARTFLRLGAARALARAEMSDMRAGITAAVSQTDRRWYGEGGNPNLKPWLSWDFDLSLEHYIGKSSYVAVAVFYKDITRGIVTKDVQYDFSGYTNASTVTPISSIGTLTTPTNTAGGIVRGVEFSWSLDGSLLSTALDGFGFTGSYSHTALSPRTDPDGVYLSTLLEGFSGNVWSGSLFYEKNGVQLRVGERYRSAYSARRHNAFLFVTENIRPETILDAQAGYTFQRGPLKDLALTLQANNLTNAAYVTSQTVSGQTAPQQYHKFGTEYLFGASYAF